MTFPVDTTDPDFPVASAGPDGLVSVAPVRAVLKCDRAAWAWSRRVLVTMAGTYDAGDTIASAAQWVAPIPTGWTRTLVLRIRAQRSTGTADVRLTCGAATATISVGTTQTWAAATLTIPSAQQGTNALVLVEDLGASGTITLRGTVYEGVGVPP